MLGYTYKKCKKRQTLVLVHGLLGSSKDFEPLISYLKDSFSILCIDLPGHGRSKDLPILGFSDLIKEIFILIENLNICFFHLMGYSLGGRVLLELVKMNSEKVLSLSLLSAHLGLNEEEKIRQLEKEAYWTKILEEASFETFLEKWYEQELFANIEKSLLKTRKENNPQSIKKTIELLSLGKQNSSLNFLENTKIPLLLSSGIRDKKYTTLYKNCLKSARKATIPNAGHALHLENPKVCAEEFCKFIKKGIT